MTVRQHRGEDVPMVLVGNKLDICDTERVVETSEAERLARAYRMSYFETSAKTGEGLEALMSDIFEKTCEATKVSIQRLLANKTNSGSTECNNDEIR